MATNPSIEQYGWTAVPRRFPTLLSQSETLTPTSKPSFVPVSSIQLPSTPLIDAVRSHAISELPTPTYHHSMRVYYYGLAILTYAFPSWSSPSFHETYFLTCLLHDIGTTDKHITATLLSFEFYGGFLTLDLLKKHSAPKEQAESVAEAIIRHQDLGDTGTLSRIGALVQLATVFDNMGQNPELVDRGTIEDVVREWPRLGWSGCFAATIRKENGLKPWAHTTHLGEREFPEGVEGNELMAPYDK